MKKSYITFPVAAFISIGLVGCGANNEGATTDGQNNQALPMGYHSNENHGDGGNARLNEENDGPLVEIMDHSYGAEGNQARQVKNERPTTQDTDGTNENNGLFNREPRFSRADANYHGHLDHSRNVTKSSYYNAYNGNLAQNISNRAKKVANVQDATSIIKGDSVIVGVILEDAAREQETLKAVKNAVQPQVNGKSVKVITNEGTFSRIKTIDNSLKEGDPKDVLDREIDSMFKTVGNRNN